jgi:hypothetical protein
VRSSNHVDAFRRGSLRHELGAVGCSRGKFHRRTYGLAFVSKPLFKSLSVEGARVRLKIGADDVELIAACPEARDGDLGLLEQHSFVSPSSIACIRLTAQVRLGFPIQI